MVNQKNKCPQCNQELEVMKYDCDECHEFHSLMCCEKCKKGFEVQERNESSD